MNSQTVDIMQTSSSAMAAAAASADLQQQQQHVLFAGIYTLVYSLRFECVFIAVFLLSWVVGKIARSTARKAPRMATVRPRGRAGPASTTANHPRGGESQQPAIPESFSGGSRNLNNAPQTLLQRDAASALAQGKIDPCKLRDAAWLLPRLTQLCSWRAERAIAVYKSALEAGLNLSQVAEAERDQLFMALVTSLIRAGLVADAMQLLGEIHGSGLLAGSALCTSAVKLLTSKHCFWEGLKIYDWLESSQKSMGTADKSVWSCFLFCAVESKAHNRCRRIFEELKAFGPPSSKDFWNMVRCGSVQGDWQLMLRILEEMRAQKLDVDNFTYNTIVASCVSADQVVEARKLVDEIDAADVITYNTLLKGYAKRGDVDECFKLYELMRSRGVAASQVTYGILLDCCINNNQVDKASMVFDLLKADGCPMNTVLYTTLIKGLAREQKVDEAMEVFKQMQNETEIQPDLITFSILLRANFDVGRLEAGLGLVELMQKMGVQPDEVIFNNMLSGCAKFGNVVLARRIYADMKASGLRPSTVTFSILIRIFSQCNLLEEAQEMLRTEPKSYNMEVEPRLFCQLIQCCINQRQGQRAVDVYKLMHEHCRPSAAAHTSVLGNCVKLNMFQTAADILAVAVTKDACVDARDANFVLESALRKKKDACAESCAASMRALGLKVDASLAARLA